jgi:hypothetical protein
MRLINAYSIAAIVLLAPAITWAHCDTLSGPVIADARLALDKRDITPALKWIKPEHEAELRTAFQQAVVVRSMGRDAKDVADRYFFETLVRLHRAGENASYTGLKDEPLEAPIALAEEALLSGSVDELVKQTSAHVAASLRQRFTAASEARKHATDSVGSGREYVARYVEFIHYVEGLHASGSEEGQSESATSHAHSQ